MFIFDMLMSFFFFGSCFKILAKLSSYSGPYSTVQTAGSVKKAPSPLDRLISTNFFIILGSRIQRFERMTWIYIGCRDAVWLVQKPAVFPGYDLPFNTKS